MEKNKQSKPKTKTSMSTEKKVQTTAQSPFCPFCCSAGLPRASKGILPAHLLLASPFSGIDTPVFRLVTSFTGCYQDIQHNLRP
jgi:hypothetical protein